MKKYLTYVILFTFYNFGYAQFKSQPISRSQKKNEIYLSAFMRSRYDIYLSIGYERNIFNISKYHFISLQGEYSRELFNAIDNDYQYFFIAPKYNFQIGRIITSLYPMFGTAPALKRHSVSINAANKFDYTKYKLTFSANVGLEYISYPPTVNPKGNFNPIYERTWLRNYRWGLSVGKYF